MAINFPNSPSDGDTYEFSGTTYTYSAAKTAWKPVSAGGGGASVSVSNTAPSNPSDGDLWYDSSVLKLYVYYADGSSSQWVQSNPGTQGPAGPTGADGSAASYANLAAFPSTGNTLGDLAVAQDTKAMYMWDGTEWDRVRTGVDEILSWSSEPNSSYDLNADGTNTSITVAASDPEGFPVTYSYDTNPTNQPQATITNSGGAFTLTPTSNTSLAGNFSLRFRASDGVHIISKTSTINLSFVPIPSVTNAKIAGTHAGYENTPWGARALQTGNIVNDGSRKITLQDNTPITNTYLDYTLSFWFKPSVVDNNSGELWIFGDEGKYSSGNYFGDFSFFTNINSGSSSVYVDRYNGADYGTFSPTTNNGLSINSWYHFIISASHNGSGGGSGFVYISSYGGTLGDTFLATGSPTHWTTTGIDLGNWYWGGSYPGGPGGTNSALGRFSLADLRIYDTNLSTTDAATLFTTTYGGGYSQNLLHYFNFNDDTTNSFAG